MTNDAALAEAFEAQRTRLHAVARRILASDAEADDVLQDAWLRLRRSDVEAVENLPGWLTTVTARLCLDRLRARGARREQLVADDLPAPGASVDPEAEALLADSVGAALTIVLDTMSPAERVAFVLHDVFAVSFDAIGEILGRSPNAAKQLASRARARLSGASDLPEIDRVRQREVVEAFLAASRAGDLAGLVAVLAPDVVLRADPAAVAMGADPEVLGADGVAAVFAGRALEARPALVDGLVGVVWAPGGRPRVVWELEIAGGEIGRIDMLAAAQTLADLDLDFDLDLD